MRDVLRRGAATLFTSYGMIVVLAFLCVLFSWATWHEQSPDGREGAASLASDLRRDHVASGAVLVIAPDDAGGAAFADELRRQLQLPLSSTVLGDPPTVRAELERRIQRGEVPRVVATTPGCRDWALWTSLRTALPAFSGVTVRSAVASGRSLFLAPTNLRNVADQIAVIAILAVGMTLVVITGGIDLSVGSLIALAAVCCAWGIRWLGGLGASSGALWLASLAAIVLCGCVGGFSGLMITRFRIPPFIATLAMMQVASGLAFIVARGNSIYDIPERFTWLGRGASLAAIPNAVVLMFVVYVLAHVFMTRTAAGRRLYAVGGNAEAARLSGVSTARTLMLAYVVSGLAAGLGGVVTASQLKAGAPTYGVSYELYVIAAVVVGGASLSGGEGRVLGTLIGAFIIAVIRNGMNLMNVEPYTQKVVLGMVILASVLLDMLKRRGWRRSGATAA